MNLVAQGAAVSLRLRECKSMAVGSKGRITISSLLFFSVVLYAAMWLPVSLPPRWTALLRFEYPFSPKKHALKDELDIALEETSMDNKMLIIAVLNKAYMGENGMLDLFLQSLHQGEKTEFLINHLLLVAVDQLAFDQCKILQLHCYQLVSDSASFSNEAFYMSDDFIKMMWRRTQFLREVLRRGYNFIFTDMDILWLRNPLTKLSGEDLQISCDKYNSQRPFDAASNLINTGFYFISANKRTIALFDHWNGAMNRSLGMKDQDVLLKMNIEGVLGKLGVTVKYLDNNYFSGFCQKSRDFRKVITMHANCCIGTKAKLIDLRAFFEAWKIHNGTSNATWPAHKSCLFAKDK